jgi:NADPH:quinone reductase-like Zn-dependent oxidoreductase
MRAVVQDKYGLEPADVLRLEEIDRPQIGEDDVLVRIHAASVHIGDWHVMTGLPYLLRVVGFGFRAPKVRVRGMDVAGTVETVGTNVSKFRAGDEVYGTCNGSFAEYVSTPQDTLAPKPGNLPFEQAATIPTSAIAALQALRDAGRLRPGQQVLVVGASGGVGMFAVQIAKAFGAEVTGVCSTAKVDLVRSLGADHVIDYTREDFTRSGPQYDLILDMGGNRSLSQLRRALRSGGTPRIGRQRTGQSVGRGQGLDPIHAAVTVRQESAPAHLRAKPSRPATPERTHRDRQSHAGDRQDLSAEPGAGRHRVSESGTCPGKDRHRHLSADPIQQFHRTSGPVLSCQHPQKKDHA